MIEKLCNFLTNKIRKEMPEVDDERAEVINYGLQILVGEVPKTFILLIIAYLLGVFKLAILTLLFIAPYRTFSGGVHMKTHIGCIITTTLFYCGTALISKNIVLEPILLKYCLIFAIWIFSMWMIKLYAPADTEAVPILSKKDRKFKKIMSYITMSITLIVAIFIKNNVISNILIFGTLFQTILITKAIYKITNNKYGYEEYLKSQIVYK